MDFKLNENITTQPNRNQICREITTWTEHRKGFCWNRRPAEILARRWNRQRCATCFVGSWDPGLCFFGCCNAGFVENAKTWCLSEWEIQRRWQIRKAELDKKQVNWKQDQHNNEHFNAFRILPSGDLEFQCTGRIEVTISMLSQETYQVAKVNGTSFNKNLPVPLRWKNSFFIQQFASKSKVLPSICWLIHWSAFGCSSHGNAWGISFNKAWHQLFPP